MKELIIPPAAQRDDQSIEMLRAWVAEEGLHCSLKIGVWEGRSDTTEERAWGILLADVVKHIANAMRDKYGSDISETKVRIVKALFKELEMPTSEAKGAFWNH